MGTVRLSKAITPAFFDEIFFDSSIRSSMNQRAPLPLPIGGDAGVRSHCQRVSTWARELAGALGLSDPERGLVGQAAIFHHLSPVLLDDDARHRLLTDVGVQEDDGPALIPEVVRHLLQVFWRRELIADPNDVRLAAVLEICDDFDQYFEAESLAEADASDECSNSSVETMMSYLQLSSRADVSRVIDRLPVFPRAAREVLRYVTNPEVSVGELVRVVSLDPVLAGLLIQAANSVFYSPRTPVTDIRHAISYIGFEATRKVLLGAVLRPVYASSRLHPLWNHSLDVAQAAEWLAQRSSLPIDSSDAFLAGLVHDVGRLAFSIMPAAFLERFYRLTDGGCAPVQVEVCLSGLCHGEVGAETLKQWKFSDPMVEAIRWHHRPERSPLALPSLLYLAEFVTGSEEGLPSWVRLKTACRQAGVGVETLAEIGGKGKGYLESLRFDAA